MLGLEAYLRLSFLNYTTMGGSAIAQFNGGGGGGSGGGSAGRGGGGRRKKWCWGVREKGLEMNELEGVRK